MGTAGDSRQRPALLRVLIPITQNALHPVFSIGPGTPPTGRNGLARGLGKPLYEDQPVPC